MKKNSLAYVLPVCAILLLFFAAGNFSPQHVMAGEVKSNDDYIYQYNKKTKGIEILSYKGSDTIVTVPDTIDGKPVAVIGKQAFKEGQAVSEADAIREVTLPDSVTLIKEEAFCACYFLKKVRLPNTLKTMEKGVFTSCDNLQEIDLPESLTELPLGAFDFAGLKRIVIPANIKTIGGACFFNCSSLEEVEFAKNSKLEVIDEEAFARCPIKEITFPDSLQVIKRKAFEDNWDLKQIKFGKKSKLKEFGINCFDDCKSLMKVTIPKKVKIINWAAFYGCKKLKQITFCGPVPAIDKFAFGKIDEKAVFKVPAKYKTTYKKVLSKLKGYKKTMRIRTI